MLSFHNSKVILERSLIDHAIHRRPGVTDSVEMHHRDGSRGDNDDVDGHYRGNEPPIQLLSPARFEAEERATRLKGRRRRGCGARG